MDDWRLKEQDLKKYPHFDSFISPSDAEALATDPERVARHSFFPFIMFNKHWTRFAKKGSKGKPKDRPIRYAARRDAYIFSYYRHLLSHKYETELRALGLNNTVLAYRRILCEDGTGGKCNIHYARDAFHNIRELGNCCAIALDISSYFESLDHSRLKALWCRVLGKNQLPKDHFSVFKAITQYAYVDKLAAYQRLGHFGEKRKSKSGKPINGYLTPFREIPKQLCKGNEFREKICGENGEKSIIQKNYRPYGIPQGAPISDLLANLYLIDFDAMVKNYVDIIGGAYYRYSDDILILTPGDEVIAKETMNWVRTLISEFGRKLVIKEEKCSLVLFIEQNGRQECRQIYGQKEQNGLEYLGFRYDGRYAYIRNSTITNLNRKIVRATKRNANAWARRYPSRNAQELRSTFNYEELIKRFGKVEDFSQKQSEYRSWTFWTYARRASEAFGSLGTPILSQLKNYRAFVQNCAEKELDLAANRRNDNS